MKAKRIYAIVDYMLDEFLTLIVTKNIEHNRRRNSEKEFMLVTVYGSHNQLNELEHQWSVQKSRYDAEYIPAQNIHSQQADKRQTKYSLI